ASDHREALGSWRPKSTPAVTSWVVKSYYRSTGRARRRALLWPIGETDGSFLITPDALTETCRFRPHLAGGNIGGNFPSRIRKPLKTLSPEARFGSSHVHSNQRVTEHY